MVEACREYRGFFCIFFGKMLHLNSHSCCIFSNERLDRSVRAQM